MNETRLALTAIMLSKHRCPTSLLLAFALGFALCGLAACGTARTASIPVSQLQDSLRQKNGAPSDSSQSRTAVDSLENFPSSDTLRNAIALRDSTKLDSTKSDSSKKSPAGLEDVVRYTSPDSVIYDLKAKRMYLYGDGSQISYQEFKLVAPAVAVNTDSSTLTAQSHFDSLGKLTSQPVFRDAGGEYVASSMAYNFKTKRGKVSVATTKIDEGYYSGEKIKRMEDGSLNIEDGRYTTCNHNPPHYYFYAKQMKIVPKDRIFARPIVLYIEGVPLFALPFIFFPSQSGRASGIIVPRYGFDTFKGYYLAQGGYYWAIDDYSDFKIDGDWGTRGSYRVGSRFNYAKRYDYTGAIDAEFERLFFNESTDPDFSQTDRWTIGILHSQIFDPTLDANLNLRFNGGNQFSLNSISGYSIVNQDVTSNASINKRFNENTSLSFGYTRTQRLTDQSAGQSFALTFFTGQLFPFKRKGGTGQSFAEKLIISPASTSLNFSTQDAPTASSNTSSFGTGVSLAYQQQFSTEFQANISASVSASGQLQHTSPASDLSGIGLVYPLAISGTAFRYFNFGASVSVNQFIVDRTAEKFYNPVDSTVVTRFTKGSTGFATYGFNFGLSSRIYGIANTEWLENLVGIKAFRHVLEPNISYQYTPDFSTDGYGFFRTYIDSAGTAVKYSKFEGALYSPGASAVQNLAVSLSNRFDVKVRTEDTTRAIDDPQRNERVYQFLNVNLSSGYNFGATAFNLAPLNLSATSNTLAPYLNLSGSVTFDFYSYDSVGTRINRYLLDDGRGLARLTSFDLNFSTSLQGQKQSNPDRLTSPQDSLRVEEEKIRRKALGLPPTDFSTLAGDGAVDFDVPWQLSAGVNIRSTQPNPLVPATVVATANANASFSPTPNWKISANGGYSFTDRQFTFPTIYVSRDLHCWEMSFQWTPVGLYRSYFFSIGLKAPQLRDIKLERRETPVDLFQTR
ncbi:MAG: LPS-assembly protein LptD [Rhizobacter sp.]|nr:LPS-assembly protein LptD [Chlorobiales bacterium]